MRLRELPTLRTERLVLRALSEDDIDGFAALHASGPVMDKLGPTLSRAESEAALARIRREGDDDGLGHWAIESAGDARFVGLVGLSRPTFQTAFTPCVQIVWRLLPDFWGRGLATEAARASLDFGFTALKLTEVLAWTTRDHFASRSVMAKLGMRHDPAGDFDHPALPATHPLRRHVLYRAQATPRKA